MRASPWARLCLPYDPGVAHLSVPMRHAATAVVALTCAYGATTAQATTTSRPVARCHMHAVVVHGRRRCPHGSRPANKLQVRELVWEAPVKHSARRVGVVLELVTEVSPANAGEPDSAAEAKKEAEEEAQEVRQEAAEDAKERAEETS